MMSWSQLYVATTASTVVTAAVPVPHRMIATTLFCNTTTTMTTTTEMGSCEAGKYVDEKMKAPSPGK